jgi:hypothetical protein
LLGNYDTYTQANRYLVGQYHYQNYEWYVQDSWKVRHNLTVNCGLRMTLMPPWTEGSNQIYSFEPQLYNQANKVVLYAPTCANGVFPCSGALPGGGGFTDIFSCQ